MSAVERIEDACMAVMGGAMCTLPKGHDGSHCCEYVVLDRLGEEWRNR